MHEKKHEENGGKKKLHLHAIKHTIAKDGSVVHEHEYKKHPDDEHVSHRTLAGTSSDMDDVHQHLEDNLAPAMQEAGGAPPEEASGPAAGGDAGGAAPAEDGPEAAQ